MSRKFETIFYGDVINCVKDENGKEYNLQEMIAILNEQSERIKSLEMELDLIANTKLFSRRKLEEENEQLRRLFEEMKQPITINLTEEDEKELRKLLGLIDDE